LIRHKKENKKEPIRQFNYNVIKGNRGESRFNHRAPVYIYYIVYLHIQRTNSPNQ